MGGKSRNWLDGGHVSRPMHHLLDRRTLGVWLAAMLALAATACGSLGSTTPPPGSTTPPPPGPSGAPMTAVELRLFLVHRLGPLWYCDPDSYPVGRDEQQSAIDRYAEMVAEHDLFSAVANDVGVDPAAPPSDAEKLTIYKAWKVARGVSLEPIGNDRYRFDYLAHPDPGASEGKRTAGIVDASGMITVEQEALEGEPVCPICLAIGTLIDTPEGSIAVDRLRLGDTIWTLDSKGRRLPGSVIALGSAPAPAGHLVIRLVLADGRTVTASPGHPLGDRRALGALTIGDIVAGSVVIGLETVRYAGSSTYDLVVSGDSGIYLAGGIPLGSTIDRRGR